VTCLDYESNGRRLSIRSFESLGSASLDTDYVRRKTHVRNLVGNRSVIGAEVVQAFIREETLAATSPLLPSYLAQFLLNLLFARGELLSVSTIGLFA
jgi:hypothetical protein